jgi:hypothetical protein
MSAEFNHQLTDDNGFIGFRGFTQSKIQSTPTPVSARLELRHRTIAFVSAGTSTPPIELKHKFVESESEDSEEMDDNADDSAILTNMVTDIDATVPNHGMASMDLEDRADEMEVETHEPHSVRALNASRVTSTGISLEAESPLFVVDTAGDEKLARSSGVTSTGKATEAEIPLFVVDTAGDEKLAKSSKVKSRPLVVRPPSPARSDSSEEQVVFHGRGRAKVVNDQLHISSKTNTADAFEVADRLDTHASTSIAFGVGPGKLAKETEDALQGFTPAPSGSWWRNHAPGEAQPTLEAVMATSSKAKLQTSQDRLDLTGRQTKVTHDKDAENTISSLQADWRKVQREKKASRKGDGLLNQPDNSNARTPNRRGKKGRKKGNRALRAATDSDDDDEAAEAAYDDYMANLAAQLEEEEQEAGGTQGTVSGLMAFARTSGLEGPSLVVDGRVIPDDEVLPRKLKRSKENGQNTEPSDDSAWVSDGSESSGSSGSEDEDEDEDEDQSDLEDEIEYTEAQMYDDEDDLRQRRIAGLEDEKIARLFAKQAEWGIDADELLIEDGDFDDGIGDLVEAQLGLTNLNNFAYRSTPSKRPKRAGKREANRFVDATALADSLDQYGNNGFDIMDFDRPSLRPLKKGRKGKIPAALEAISDDELREVTMMSWENDREKKRLKKLEREEQRMDGLLGKAARTGRTDLKAKYSTGITIKQCLDELYAFLLEVDLEQRAFPPMAKADRKALHEICTRMNLNSKSQGAGKHRFPIITKTQRTPCPGDAEFDAFVEIARSGTITTHGQVYKLKNTLARKGRAARTVGTGRGGAGSNHAPRNGEIVGASAQKIGSDSFGHRMMQKMGWTEGKGLGQSGEGLVNPVEQRMRFGTAGLG